MLRRRLLQGATAMMAWPMPALRVPANASPRRSPVRRRRPADPGWPSAAQWQQLDKSVGGNLMAVQPMLAPCEVSAVSAACLAVTNHLRNPFFVGDQVAGTQVSGWLGAWVPAASAFAIRATSTADVVAGVNFARDHQLRLVVKGAGHSYQGTSNAADSLLIWTRAMNEVTLHDSFVPACCEGRVAPVEAVSAQAGALWIDLYHAVTTVRGRYVQGGGCADVGVAGLIQSGGFGSFSKGFGSAASSLLEAEIVTADGQVRTVNACCDPELFWALKGGGGGSWGVVTRVTLRTHALPKFFGAAWGLVKARSDDAYRKLLARFVDFYADALFNPHWGEQLAISPDNTLKIAMVCQGVDSRQAEMTWKPFFDWVKASPQDFTIVEEMGSWVGDARRWWAVEGNQSMIPDTRVGAKKHHGWWKGDQDQVGAWLHGYDSLWLPAKLLEASQRPRLVDALLASSRHKRLDLQFNKGLAGSPAAAIESARDTATNPVVCEAFALVIIADGEGPAYPGFPRSPPDLAAARQTAANIDLAAAALRQVVPNAGSYVSESNYFNPNWKREFWGPNAARLEAVKARIDPEGLFFVHHGVGSEAWSADGFDRL
ncbi:MAG: FAD-binding oxidoreductase [Vitreoscilla sp.]|nr:FAD-binding oxidoreductase [Vitreoscilla sp.]